MPQTDGIRRTKARTYLISNENRHAMPSNFVYVRVCVCVRRRRPELLTRPFIRIVCRGGRAGSGSSSRARFVKSNQCAGAAVASGGPAV